jgi:uncharacterized protein YkwD
MSVVDPHGEGSNGEDSNGEAQEVLTECTVSGSLELSGDAFLGLSQAIQELALANAFARTVGVDSGQVAVLRLEDGEEMEDDVDEDGEWVEEADGEWKEKGGANEGAMMSTAQFRRRRSRARRRLRRSRERRRLVGADSDRSVPSSRLSAVPSRPSSSESESIIDAQASSLQSLAYDFVKEHNVKRCIHGLGPDNFVKWNQDAVEGADGAQAWADKGVYEHNLQAYSVGPPAGPAGENIALFSASSTSPSNVSSSSAVVHSLQQALQLLYPMCPLLTLSCSLSLASPLSCLSVSTTTGGRQVVFRGQLLRLVLRLQGWCHCLSPHLPLYRHCVEVNLSNSVRIE